MPRENYWRLSYADEFGMGRVGLLNLNADDSQAMAWINKDCLQQHTAKGHNMRSAESFDAHVVYKTTVWNKTEVGRAAMVRGNATRKERNKKLAAMKGIAVFNHAKFDKVPVQLALMTWGST